MIIAFFGHADFAGSVTIREKLIEVLRSCAENEKIELLFGGYGAFDRFAFETGKIFRALYPQTKLVLVTPYLSNTKTLQEKEKGYDETIYPPIESVPKKFAISARNKWMAEKANMIIAYVDHDWGGAYQVCLYAFRKGKKIVQLGKSATH